MCGRSRDQCVCICVIWAISLSVPHLSTELEYKCLKERDRGDGPGGGNENAQGIGGLTVPLLSSSVTYCSQSSLYLQSTIAEEHGVLVNARMSMLIDSESNTICEARYILLLAWNL